MLSSFLELPNTVVFQGMEGCAFGANRVATAHAVALCRYSDLPILEDIYSQPGPRCVHPGPYVDDSGALRNAESILQGLPVILHVCG